MEQAGIHGHAFPLQPQILDQLHRRLMPRAAGFLGTGVVGYAGT
jgi:hypothetical protein